MNRLATVLFAALFLCGMGCAKKVTKHWEAAGGSRADATVIVGYTYNPQLEIPMPDGFQAHEEAVKRCQAWGYQEAEAFGLVTKRCQDPQCVEMLVTQQYQCLGRGDMSTPLDGEAAKGKKIRP